VNGFGNPVWNWFTDTFQINNEIKIKTDAVAIKEQRLETAIELFLQQKPASNILLNKYTRQLATAFTSRKI
jgi:hypothetical protein